MGYQTDNCLNWAMKFSILGNMIYGIIFTSLAKLGEDIFFILGVMIHGIPCIPLAEVGDYIFNFIGHDYLPDCRRMLR